ncbi:ECF-type sigma factor [Dokdonella sp.]|uniref:ECF-type sigma factor n=1 Tax=Dokdonella sp. TaxID=2291710 RepID=UPI003C4764D9
MSTDITGGLNAEGGPQLEDGLYRALRQIAKRELGRVHGQRTLNPTALVNEAWLKLASAESEWSSRQHFTATMAKVMRHVLIDYARERGAQRRGGDAVYVTFDGIDVDDARGEAVDLLAIDQAIQRLGELDARLEQVIELRFFAGLTVPEIARTVGRSEPTIKRDLRTARAFIGAELGGAT